MPINCIFIDYTQLEDVAKNEDATVKIDASFLGHVENIVVNIIGR